MRPWANQISAGRVAACRRTVYLSEFGPATSAGPTSTDLVGWAQHDQAGSYNSPDEIPAH
jgi:hypothetical protein